jgi:hypothetical protein
VSDDYWFDQRYQAERHRLQELAKLTAKTVVFRSDMGGGKFKLTEHLLRDERHTCCGRVDLEPADLEDPANGGVKIKQCGLCERRSQGIAWPMPGETTKNPTKWGS